MDQLLVACHAQTLNLFVESFLKMVQKLLESTDPQLQILATQSVSFIKQFEIPHIIFISIFFYFLSYFLNVILLFINMKNNCVFDIFQFSWTKCWLLLVCPLCQHRAGYAVLSHTLRFLCIKILCDVPLKPQWLCNPQTDTTCWDPGITGMTFIHLIIRQKFFDYELKLIIYVFVASKNLYYTIFHNLGCCKENAFWWFGRKHLGTCTHG